MNKATSFSLIDRFFDKAFNRSLKVIHKDKEVFQMVNYGPVTRHRAKNFSSKEPDTIDWIDSFDNDDLFLDIGANVGIYSCYAASQGIKTIAVEPEALNFAALNLNIRLNKIDHLVTAYCLALSETFSIDKLHVKARAKWGASHNTFSRDDLYQYEAVQGCFSMSFDSFIKGLSISPNHIKIDIDGLELDFLRGCLNSLKINSVKSILIELDLNSDEYIECFEIIEKAGFKERSNSELKNLKIRNHIFYR
jgi:FkbM family methyltransferase